MNWEAIGAVAETLGAAGVIASLVYLSIQIRSNTKQLRFDASQAIAESLDRAADPIYSEPAASAWHKGHHDFDALTGAEKTLFHNLMARHVHNLTNALEAQDTNMVDKTKMQSLYSKFYADIFGTPGGKQWLEENPHFLDAGFIGDALDDTENKR